MIRMLLGALALVGVSACVSSKKDLLGERGPSSVQNEQKLIAYVEGILEWDRKDRKLNYRVMHYPIRQIIDITPALPGEAVAQLGREMSEIWSLFSQNQTISDYGPDWVREVLFRHLTAEQRSSLLQVCYSKPKAVGDRFPLATMRAGLLCENESVLYTEEDIREAFINFPAKPEGVRYDGAYGFHRYTDLKLARLVNLLTSAANHKKADFLKVFHSLPPERQAIFRVNRDGLGEDDKIEAFDLIATATTGQIYSRTYGRDSELGTDLNKIQISKLSQRALAFALGLMGPENSSLHVTPAMSVIRNDSKLSVFCANGIFDSQTSQMQTRRRRDQNGATAWSELLWEKSGPSELVEIWSPRFEISKVLEQGGVSIPFFCNSNEYRFTLKKQNGTEIPVPQALDFSKREELQALMTISLVSEIDLSAINKGKMLLSTLGGWTIEEDLKLVQTRPVFLEEFKKADAYIPVMHAMDVNYFHMGTSKSYTLKIKREVLGSDGRRRDLKLTLMFPGGAALDSVIMNPQELAEIMDQRYQSKGTSLFLMNNSCASEKTLVAWSLVFRRALEIRQKRGDDSAVRDFPYVIGSKRFFATGSTLEIFSHADYPLRSLEMLTAGSSYQEVIDFLKKPASQGFLQNITSFFSGSDTNKLEAKSRGFEPESNLDHPELRSLNAIEMSVQGRGIKGENRY